jgi:hypothetical protein
LRAHEISQLLAITFGILTSLALDGSELFLETTHFAVFCVVVLLSLGFRLFEILETFVDLGSRTIRVLDVRFPLSLEIHQAVVVWSA